MKPTNYQWDKREGSVQIYVCVHESALNDNTVLIDESVFTIMKKAMIYSPGVYQQGLSPSQSPVSSVIILYAQAL